jgi:hypothetical protein
MALTYDELDTVSTPFYTKEITSQIYDKSAFFNKLKRNNSITTDGGTEIRFPIRYKELGTAKAMGPREQLLYTQLATRTTGVQEWKYYEVHTMMQWDEKIQNSGKEKIVNLMADKAEEMQEEMSEKLSDDLFATTAVTNQFSALDEIVDSGDTYAGIAVADAAAWAATEDSTTTRLILYGSGSLSYMINTATFGNRKPTFGLTTRNIKSKLESLLQPQERFVDKDTANAGFPNVEFLGIPFVGDSHCTTAYIYGLDMDMFELRVHKDADFKVNGWSDLTQAGFPNTSIKTMFLVCNTVCKLRKTSFKFSAIDYTL